MGKLRGDSLAQHLCPACLFPRRAIARLAGRNTTRPGSLEFGRGYVSCQLVCAKLYFCLQDPAQGDGWYNEI